jgi:alkylated DNA nucleotide flippase Atl1
VEEEVGWQRSVRRGGRVALWEEEVRRQWELQRRCGYEVGRRMEKKKEIRNEYDMWAHWL